MKISFKSYEGSIQKYRQLSQKSAPALQISEFSDRYGENSAPIVSYASISIKTPEYNPFKTGILPIEERNRLFPEDKLYRKKIAESLNIQNPDKLSAVIGKEELYEILKNAAPVNFNPETNEKGESQNPDFSINLHIHTKHSDGLFEVSELLDKAQKYAEKSGKPFLFAVSDHDILNGAKQAVKLISEKPEKYDKILFVPAVEMNAKYVNGNFFNKTSNQAVQMEILGYCVNPFDENLNNFFEERRAENIKYVKSIINELQKTGLEVSFDEAVQYEKDTPERKNHLAYMGSPGIMTDLKNYLISKVFLIKNLSDQKRIADEVNKIYIEHINRCGSKYLMPASPEMQEIISLIKQQKALCAIAHPARIELGGIITDADNAIQTIINDFLTAGGDFTESNYQYKADINSSIQNWINKINGCYASKYPDKPGTGGIDNHGKSLFVNM